MIQSYSCANNNTSEIIEVDINAQNNNDSVEFFPWLYTVFINVNSTKLICEHQDIKACKQLLIDGFNKSGIYAGCKIVDSWHELYFYLKSPKGAESKTRDILKTFDYMFESNAIKDKKWKFYETELLPDKYQRHHIQNRQIIDELINAGDDITQNREVEHYVIFDTSSLREKFYNVLEQNFLTCKEIFDDDGYHMSLVQIQNLNYNDMCNFTDKLIDLSDQFHANYIGWSTKLAKDV